jgi:hypothetical protein
MRVVCRIARALIVRCVDRNFVIRQLDHVMSSVVIDVLTELPEGINGGADLWWGWMLHGQVGEVR